VSLGTGAGISLEMKWNRVRYKVYLEGALKRFLKSVEKKAKQRKEKLSSLKDLDLIKRDSLCYRWNTEKVSAFGALWQCEKCKRVMLAQVINQNKGAAARILNTVKCHPETPEAYWGVYGLGFKVPERFILKAGVFKAGYLKLEFGAGNESLLVERWGLAEGLLEGKTLLEWFEACYKELLKGRAIEAKETDIAGHRGLLIALPAKKGLLNTIGLKRTRTAYYAWHCPGSNRIMVAGGELGVQDAAGLQRIAGSIECHPKT
jgi:hypothetical protein